MLGTVSREPSKGRGACDEVLRISAPTAQRMGEPVREIGMIGFLPRQRGAWFEMNKMEKIQQEPLGLEAIRRPETQLLKSGSETSKLIGRQCVMDGHRPVAAIPEGIIIPEVSILDKNKHIGGKGNVMNKDAARVGTEAVGVLRAYHDQYARTEGTFLAIDPVGSSALCDPENFREIMAVDGKRTRAAEESARRPTGAFPADFLPLKSLHDIILPEHFVIAQVDSPTALEYSASSMNTPSFMTANFVARQLNYSMTKGWWEGDQSVNKYFQPEDTFAERFDAMLGEITPLGFTAIDLWVAHLNPDWATQRQIEEAAAILKDRGLSVSSLAIGIPDDLSKLEQTAAIAEAVGTRILGGSCGAGLLENRRDEVLAALEKYDLIFGYENHPERGAAEMLGKIGSPCDGRIGVTLDTGWFGTYGTDAATAIRELGDRLVHIHLKDIFEPHVRSEHEDIRVAADVNPTLKDMGHETCALGDGVVGIERCVIALKETGYTGGISVEHEPEDHSPIEDVKLGLARLNAWLNQ